jgi:serine protease Do
MTGKDIYQKHASDVYGVLEEGRLRASAISLGQGLFATVSHPLEDPESIALVDQAGQKLTAKVLGWDNRYDLAVLEAQTDKPALSSGSKAKVLPGARVWSLGYDRQGPRIHGGIVAQVRATRTLPMGGEISPAWEVDGSLSPSMSGGPLFGEEGEFLGMNSLMPRGTGMTLPGDHLLILAKTIQDKGNPKLGYLGITTTGARTKDGGHCLLITAIEEGSPAAVAGLMVGGSNIRARGGDFGSQSQTVLPP